MKKFLIIVVSIIGVSAILLFLNFIPTFSLGNGKMSVFVGEWVNVYYEEEKAAARDTFELAEKRAEELAKLLGIEKQKINIYIYDSQKTLQRKKYGLVASFLGLDWYIGDNIGSDVILTSPANPGKKHDYNSVKNAVLHEMVHAYNYILNKEMSYWVDNGIAGYLSNQDPGTEFMKFTSIPTLEQTQIKGLLAPIKFANFGGYEYSYSYIEYLAETYPWDSVRQFAKSGDYEAAFGASEQEIYDGWIEWCKEYSTSSRHQALSPDQ